MAPKPLFDSDANHRAMTKALLAYLGELEQSKANLDAVSFDTFQENLRYLMGGAYGYLSSNRLNYKQLNSILKRNKVPYYIYSFPVPKSWDGGVVCMGYTIRKQIKEVHKDGIQD